MPSCPLRRVEVHLPAPGCRCRVDAAPVHHMIKVLAGAGWSLDHAARHGWPLVDHVVIMRLVAGTPCPHTKAERDAAVRILAARNTYTPTEIAVRVGTSNRIVARTMAVAA